MSAFALMLITLGQAPEQTTRWQVDGVTREALVFPATNPSPAGVPLVFVFHGHGGNQHNAARRMAIHEAWPEAIVVYPQGLPTPGRFDPEGARSGWQKTPGDQTDRDLRFFDTMLADLQRRHRIDADRVYATGHSNGGGFCYLLWSERHDQLAAVAPSAAGSRNVRSLAPLAAMHLAGRADERVPFANQQRTIDAVRRVNGCIDEGQPWGDGGLLYTSPGGTPFLSYIHEGGHAFPEDAAPLIARFLREQKRGDAGGS